MSNLPFWKNVLGADFNSLEGEKHEIKHEQNQNLKIEISNVGSGSLIIYFRTELMDKGLICNISVSGLDTDNVNYTISNHDMPSYFSDMSSSIDEYEELIELIHLSRITSIVLVRELQEIELELKAFVSNQEEKRKLEEQKRAENAKVKEQDRINKYLNSHVSLGEEKAKTLLLDMEKECKESGKPQEFTLEFLRSNGYPTKRSYRVSIENDAITWKSGRGTLLDSSSLWEEIAKAKIKKD